MLCDQFLSLNRGGASVAKVARRPVSIVCGVQCFHVSLLTSRVGQFGLVSGALVACVGKMRLA